MMPDNLYRSFLDSLLWEKKGKLLVSVSQPETFPFNLLLDAEREERTGGAMRSLVKSYVEVLGVLP